MPAGAGVPAGAAAAATSTQLTQAAVREQSPKRETTISVNCLAAGTRAEPACGHGGSVVPRGSPVQPATPGRTAQGWGHLQPAPCTLPGTALAPRDPSPLPTGCPRPVPSPVCPCPPVSPTGAVPAPTGGSWRAQAPSAGAPVPGQGCPHTPPVPRALQRCQLGCVRDDVISRHSEGLNAGRANEREGTAGPGLRELIPSLPGRSRTPPPRAVPLQHPKALRPSPLPLEPRICHGPANEYKRFNYPGTGTAQPQSA